MIELKDFTLKVFKLDRRCKAGEKLVGVYDYPRKHLQWMKEEVRDLQAGAMPADKYRIELHETYVERTNLMTREKYMERFDTPHCCSPASETYWSM